MKKRKLLPLGIKKRTTTELPALIALEAIGKPWFCETHLTDLMAVSMVCQVAAEPGSEIHAAGCELFELLGHEQLDIARIEPLVVLTNDWVQRQPNGRIQDAIERLMSQKPAAAPTS
ncbi:hypothetical protein [Cognatazoarcus halotolerans]|uniref:hypothetical protein n=1 Tax=Cognatazoarcus halotolerans TaxID=2686016 RepID=UPI001358E02B|nr:hypothetical protein [Cognatazoarcus halotolerans]MCB1898526.1 hypothetical protein [Rhodocyclaceae bacterium]MCP5310504.1 hypothetical protein [Zoogloeaceae bacterium]